MSDFKLKFSRLLIKLDRFFTVCCKAAAFLIKYAALFFAIAFMLEKQYEDASICFSIACVFFGYEYLTIVIPRQWRSFKRGLVSVLAKLLKIS